MKPINYKQLTIAVLYGGSSSEREISLQSGQAVYQGLKNAGYQVKLFDPHNRALEDLKTQNVDFVFNILHGGEGENGRVQALLDHWGIGYTGSGVLASALAMDKYRTKLVWQALGLPSAPMQVIFKGDAYCCDHICQRLGLPLFVKPSGEGSSIGVSKVTHADQLAQAITHALRYDDCVLVEQAIDGGEFSTPILGDKVLPTIEVIPDGEFYDYNAKYISKKTQYRCPGLSDDEQEKVADLVLKAHHALGCEGYSRVDFMKNKQGDIFLMEVNTNPGMTTHSYFPKSAAHIGMSFEQLVEQMLLLALTKYYER